MSIYSTSSGLMPSKVEASKTLIIGNGDVKTLDDAMEKYLAQAARKYYLIAVGCLDDNEKTIPSVGFITVEDLETGELVEVDARRGIGQFLAARVDEQNKLFRKHGIDLLDIVPKKTDYLIDVVRFFRRRMMY
jgi:hypothetical protein